MSFRGVTNSSVAVRWQRPRHPNGIVQGYRLYYVHKNFTDVQTVRDPEEDMEHTLHGLGEYIRQEMMALPDVVRHFRFRSRETKSSDRREIEDHYLEREEGGGRDEELPAWHWDLGFASIGENYHISPRLPKEKSNFNLNRQ